MNSMSLSARWSRCLLPVTNTLWRLALASDFQPAVDPSKWHLLHRGPHSRIYHVHGTTPCVVKLAMPRSKPRDNLRKYVACQAKREFRGNRTLASIGLRTPTVYGWGVTPSPFAYYESALFMRPLPDFKSGLTVIRKENDAAKRRHFLDTLAEQLACLQGNGYIHKDAHFGNLCVPGDGSLVWIDNDIRRPATISARRSGLAKSLRLLEKTARDAVAPHEWQFFNHRLRTCLARWPKGEELAHEVR